MSAASFSGPNGLNFLPSSQASSVHIVGAGLAGSEAAYFLASRGVPVVIHEMRPVEKTEAHLTDRCAELVCSNSFKSVAPQSGPGILKSELTLGGSMILECGLANRVPAGESLAVDRDRFSESVTQKLMSHPLIEFRRELVAAPIPGDITLFATGPLTAGALMKWIADQSDDLYFYDAIAPIVDAGSLDRSIIFEANRYNKGDEGAFLNCPFSKEEYERFIDALLAAEKVLPKHGETEKFFQGCQPIEAIADSGRDSLRFGPMKPVGLVDPRTGRTPYAAVQLRPENLAKTAYNLVGFQTKLTYPSQREVFRLIPGLERVEFFRLGSIHRNSFINSPKVLRPDLSMKGNPLVYFAGQVAGVEGYLESAACGWLAALFIYQRLNRLPHSAPPANTGLGALLRHMTGSDAKHFQPNNLHFGTFDQLLFSGLNGQKKDQVKSIMTEQCRMTFLNWWHSGDWRKRTHE